MNLFKTFFVLVSILALIVFVFLLLIRQGYGFYSIAKYHGADTTAFSSRYSEFGFWRASTLSRIEEATTLLGDPLETIILRCSEDDHASMRVLSCKMCKNNEEPYHLYHFTKSNERGTGSHLVRTIKTDALGKIKDADFDYWMD